MQTDKQTVKDSGPTRVGPVSRDFSGQYILQGLQFPSAGNPELKLGLAKQMRVKVAYETKTHDEGIFKRTPAPGQLPIEHFSEKAKDTSPLGLIGSVFELAFLPAYVLLDIHPGTTHHEETRKERVPGSEAVQVQYSFESSSEPAAREMLVVDGLGNVVTDDNGVIAVRIALEKFDSGVQVSHKESGRVYTVQREKRTREYKAAWYPTAKTVTAVAGVGHAIYEVRKLIVAGAGPQAYIVALIVDYVAERIIGFIVEVAATTRNEFVEWRIILLR